MKIGARIRGIRKKRGLTISQLASRAGISTSLISQAERDNIAPSIGTLDRISNSLGVPLATLFLEQSSKPEVLRYKPMPPNDQTSPKRQLHANTAGRFLPETLRIPPGTTMTLKGDPDQHGFGIVLSGAIELQNDEEDTHLEQRDAVYIRAVSRLQLANKTLRVAEVLWLWLPARLD
ncbi:MAG: hypothetical protein COB53_09210 [Elusimicrobia bacterium]|nr:MAG: hypothetical protein COB53_09210 [Elusimicrobiota bacterium]